MVVNRSSHRGQPPGRSTVGRANVRPLKVARVSATAGAPVAIITSVSSSPRRTSDATRCPRAGPTPLAITSPLARAMLGPDAAGTAAPARTGGSTSARRAAATGSTATVATAQTATATRRPPGRHREPEAARHRLNDGTGRDRRTSGPPDDGRNRAESRPPSERPGRARPSTGTPSRVTGSAARRRTPAALWGPVQGVERDGTTSGAMPPLSRGTRGGCLDAAGTDPGADSSEGPDAPEGSVSPGSTPGQGRCGSGTGLGLSGGEGGI